MDDILLSYCNVCVQFENSDTYALKNMSFNVRRGEFITILGNSGSGKTTLLKLTNRLQVLTGGTILFEAGDISQLDVLSLRKRMGYVIQQVGLFPHMTIEQNIGIAARIHKIPQQELRRRIDSLLELTKLPVSDEFKRRHPWQLSGGQQQRVGLARALCTDPEILLMDEPFGALDSVTRRQLQNELLQIQNSSGKTVLFVTHDLNEAILLGDRVLVLNEGEIQQFARPIDLVFNPANDYVKKLCNAQTFSQKLRFFRVKDFAGQIRQGSMCDGRSIQWDDSMELVLDSLLLGEQDMNVLQNGKFVGVLDCRYFKRLQAGEAGV